ncbi:MAG TPA: zinc dependent phospholipase C family protein [Terriglobia bacterium]|nr:zinc dependent phospholipase C family protein [Terriglobia bacterium]
MLRTLLFYKAPWLMVPAALLLAAAPGLRAYSVLSHEALVDAVWRPVMVPLLLSRYPTATAAELREAHAYAYGGCVIQDMGYYPLGDHFFSNLAHYVRSADFIRSLLENSRNLDEYAFALGALSHYVADNTGHPFAVNLAVPALYPKLRAQYGGRVTYEDDPEAHLMVEFSFDVVQIAGAGYLPRTYHNYIGFKVAKKLLERSFLETYGLKFSRLFLWEGLSLRVYRFGASAVVPNLTEAVWRQKKKKILRLYPTIVNKKFVYRLARGNFERDWGANYKPPRFYKRWPRRLKSSVEKAQAGILARITVYLFEVLPKIGPLRTLQFKPPTPRTQALFIGSFGDTVERYHRDLNKLRAGNLVLENRNCDTGKPTVAGDYWLADKTYAQLLKKLASRHFKMVTPELRNNILAFYKNLNAPIATKGDPGKWRTVLREISTLKTLAPVEEATQAARP